MDDFLLVRSHGSGQFKAEQFAQIGDNVVFEPGVLVFHPENIELGNHIYFGHNTILKGYYKNKMVIGSGTWVGQMCFFHSAGGIRIGQNVGIGPNVQILTSVHAEEGRRKPIMHSRLDFAPVIIEDDCDIGISAIILPGVTVGKGAQIGAGAVITQNVPAYSVMAGVPGRVLRIRPE
jgi:acetyltransferase-like isoleucine patch superfamily enzyme